MAPYSEVVPGTVLIRIEGMACAHCVQAVSDALSAAGVRVITVSQGGAVIVQTDAAAVARAVTAVRDAGFGAVAEGSSAGGCCGGGAGSTRCG